MEDFTAALPAEVRGAYQESCRGMAPSVLRLSFGLTDALADDEAATEFTPATPLGEEAKRLGEESIKAWESIHRAHWGSMADATTDKRAAFLRSATHAKTVLQDVEGRYEGLMRQFDQKTAHLATVLNNACKAPTSVGDAMIDSELRAAIRAEKDPHKAIAMARTNPRAIATMPAEQAALLVTASGYNELRELHLSATVPEAVRERNEVVRALAIVNKATSELSRRANKMIDFRAAAEMGKFANWKPYTPPVTAETAAQYAAGRRAA